MEAIGSFRSVRSWRPPPCLRREYLGDGDGERWILRASRAWKRTPERSVERSAVRRFRMGEGGRPPGRRDTGRDEIAWRRGFSGHAPLSVGWQSGYEHDPITGPRQMQAQKRLTCLGGLPARGYAIIAGLSPAHRSLSTPGQENERGTPHPYGPPVLAFAP